VRCIESNASGYCLQFRGLMASSSSDDDQPKVVYFAAEEKRNNEISTELLNEVKEVKEYVELVEDDHDVACVQPCEHAQQSHAAATMGTSNDTCSKKILLAASLMASRASGQGRRVMSGRRSKPRHAPVSSSTGRLLCTLAKRTGKEFGRESLCASGCPGRNGQSLGFPAAGASAVSRKHASQAANISEPAPEERNPAHEHEKVDEATIADMQPAPNRSGGCEALREARRRWPPVAAPADQAFRGQASKARHKAGVKLRSVTDTFSVPKPSSDDTPSLSKSPQTLHTLLQSMAPARRIFPAGLPHLAGGYLGPEHRHDVTPSHSSALQGQPPLAAAVQPPSAHLPPTPASLNSILPKAVPQATPSPGSVFQSLSKRKANTSAAVHCSRHHLRRALPAPAAPPRPEAADDGIDDSLTPEFHTPMFATRQTSPLAPQTGDDPSAAWQDLPGGATTCSTACLGSARHPHPSSALPSPLLHTTLATAAPSEGECTPLPQRTPELLPQRTHSTPDFTADARLAAGSAGAAVATPEFPGLAQQQQAHAQLLSALPWHRAGGRSPARRNGKRGAKHQGGVLGRRLDEAKVCTNPDLTQHVYTACGVFVRLFRPVSRPVRGSGVSGSASLCVA
jgi:hypothetical protein